jgi:hypothetical protein
VERPNHLSWWPLLEIEHVRRADRTVHFEKLARRRLGKSQVCRWATVKLMNGGLIV